jgi:hypothetical protein
MEKPIEWHEECLKNMQSGLPEKSKTMARAQEDYYGSLMRVIKYSDQISNAKVDGKTAFDRERYGKKRVKKEVPDDPTRR